MDKRQVEANRWSLAVLALVGLIILASFRVGEVISSWLVVKVASSGTTLFFKHDGLQLGTLVLLLLQVLIAFVVAAPLVLMLTRVLSRQR